MKELSQSIIHLLADNDCVILPGIGGFIAHYESAKYSGDNNSFISPKRVVGFNSAITLNDGLIVQAYMQTHDLGYPDASRLLEKDLHKVHQQLDENGSVQIEGLGMLVRNNNSTYRFEASSFDIVTPALYALPDINVSTITGNKLQKTEIETQEALISPLQISTGNTEHEESGKEPEEHTSEVYTLSMRRSIVHTLCAVAATFIVFCCISYPLDNSLNKKSEAAVLYDILQDAPQAIGIFTEDKQNAIKPVVPENTISEKGEKETTGKEKVTATGTSEDKVSEPSAEASKPYTIVLASDVSEKNAEAFVSEIKKKGFAQAEVYQGKSMRRVIYSRYGSEQEAYSALRELNAESFASDAWVMKLK